MRVLVTGGAGYVGSACVRYFLARGWRATAFDNLSKGHAEAVPDGCLIAGDIRDGGAVARALVDVEAELVLHCAAATTVNESVTDPAVHYQNNIDGTRTVLDAMRATEVKRFLFSSTCATYGARGQEPLTETSVQEPCSPYARTKLAVEWMVQDYCRAYGLGATLLRYFNAAGASPAGEHGEDHDPESHLIPLVLEVAARRRPEVLVFGGDYPTPDGTCVRDYVHVDDLAQAHFLAAAAVAESSIQIYNVGSGRGSSVLEVIRACEAVTGGNIPYRMMERRPGDPAALVASPEKLRRELGWSAVHADLRSIAGTAWRWHRAHPRGYRGGREEGQR